MCNAEQVKNLMARYAAAGGAQLLVVQLPLDTLQGGGDAILAAFAAALAAYGSRVKLAVLDHVVSFPPVRLPIAAIIELCRGVGAKGKIHHNAVPRSISALTKHETSLIAVFTTRWAKLQFLAALSIEAWCTACSSMHATPCASLRIRQHASSPACLGKPCHTPESACPAPRLAWWKCTKTSSAARW